MRKGEEGGGGCWLGGHHVADPRWEHGRVWRCGHGGRLSCDGIGLLSDEVRDKVRKLAVKGDVKLLLLTLTGLRPLLLQVCVHAGVL